MQEATLSARLPPQNIYSKERSTSSIKRERISESLKNFFIFLFVYAGLRKLVDLEMFVKEVWGFAIFGSKQLVKIEFICLSSAELAVAVLLAIPRTRAIGWYANFGLVVAVNVSMFIMLQYAKVIPIYYGGIIPGISFMQHFIFNLFILFVALVGLLRCLDVKRHSPKII
jgi:hypothetical protein